jgi:hypothetical protein
MSTSLLNRGRTVAFLITGQEKADVLREVLLGHVTPHASLHNSSPLKAPCFGWWTRLLPACCPVRRKGGARRCRRKLLKAWLRVTVWKARSLLSPAGTRA